MRMNWITILTKKVSTLKMQLLPAILMLSLSNKIFGMADYSNCTSYRNAQPISVTRGWPMSVSCFALMSDYYTDQMFQNYEYEYTSTEVSYNYKCKIFEKKLNISYSYESVYNISQAMHVYDHGFHLNKAEADMKFKIFALISTVQASTCIYQHLNVKVDEPSYKESSNCSDVISYVAKKKLYQPLESDMCSDHHLMLDCVEPIYTNKNKSLPRTFVPSRGYNVTWYRDCNIIRDGDFDDDVIEDIMSASFSTLTIPASKVRPGMYSCQLSFDDFSKFVKHFLVNITAADMERNFTSSITPTSPSVQAELHSKLVLQCHGTYASNMFLHLYWIVNNEVYCHMYGDDEIVQDRNYTCESNSTTSKSFALINSCNVHQKEFISTLTLHNAQLSNQGLYICVVKTSALTQQGKIVLNIATNLVASTSVGRLTKLRTIGAISGACIFGAMCFIGILWYFKLDVQVLWKRYLAEVDTADCMYDVFVAYSFTSSESGEQKELLNQLINWLHLHKYSVIDQQENITTLDENLCCSQLIEIACRCHRIMILITKEYLQKTSKFYKVQLELLQNTKVRSKLIFVLSPNLLKQIEEKSQNYNPLCKVVFSATKQKKNTVLLRRNQKLSKQFFKTLEVAMPKLPKHHSSFFMLTNDIDSQRLISTGNGHSILGNSVNMTSELQSLDASIDID